MHRIRVWMRLGRGTRSRGDDSQWASNRYRSGRLLLRGMDREARSRQEETQGLTKRMKLTGAAILVSRGMKVLQAVPAAYPYRSPRKEHPMNCRCGGRPYPSMKS